MLNIVLCDDNTAFLNTLESTLNKLFIKNDFDAKVTYKSPDVIDYVKNNKTDVLFIDIQLNSKMNGLDIVEKIRETNKNIYVIFITAHLEYVFLAFQVKAFDFLPKPATADRLEKTLIRLFEDVNCSSNNFISLNNKTYIKENDIYFIKRDGMKLIFQTNSEAYETYSSFNKIAPKLPRNFVRCHKSYIANINNISSIAADHNTIMFDPNYECYIGPKYKADFLEVINKENFKWHFLF